MPCRAGLFVLALALLCLDASARPAQQSFQGTGQLRTTWRDGDHADLGCLTDRGRWTSDNSTCGTFEATPDPQTPSVFTLKTDAGYCNVYGAEFTCDAGNEAQPFGTWPENWPNGIPGQKVLRWGQYGLMASSAAGPPSLADAPEAIHLASYNEPGKFVWLTWLGL
ncbi:hypothetical protein QBC47DRAFT_444068 [Echria macrotheca]|uniref:RNase T2-like C-terminal domain-containing protein n=1 Tax=Echria macrotheca TaxID=438768 RepID=A0AAJ0FD31_9PEZI|nr:hypothetical protein QBC47DRAFT_444068 [Echria macrotheca]